MLFLGMDAASTSSISLAILPHFLHARGGVGAVSIERVFVFGDFMGYLFIIRWICAVTRNTNVRRWGPLYVDQPTNEDDPTTYSIFGYTWAFKTWILESIRVTAIRYFDRFNRYPRVAAWSNKNGRNRKDVDDIKEEMLKLREEMNARPVRQENTVPINVGQHYGFSDFSQFRSMQGGLSSFKRHANSSYFNMGTPLNFQTPMRSQPGSSGWQRQMPEQTAIHYWQPSSQPGSYYSFGQVPSHIGRPNLQTTIETQHDVDGIVDQLILFLCTNIII
uniref:Uncharacterized protein n=1 Tax=Tanacetum cinerariifolium TaxID=118510 RepID=A0A6L2KH12_TANCI|nr:hypothetical protein [Tanacetum cinerariifolium]